MKTYINDRRRGQKLIDRRHINRKSPTAWYENQNNYHTHHVGCRMVWCGCCGRGYDYLWKRRTPNKVAIKLPRERFNYGDLR